MAYAIRCDSEFAVAGDANAPFRGLRSPFNLTVMAKKATYKDAGVDLAVYAESMARLPSLLRRTHSPRVLPNEGGFAGLFQLDFAGGLFARKYRDPVLVSGTDGVGTKLMVAQLAGRHDTVGIDLVAMCANDVLCCGAEPLFFLDYVAMSHDDPPLLEAIVRGISDGCLQADMALVGGETAIMPDLYQRGDYDLAGFCVGVVERAKVLDGSTIVPSDMVLGVASSGIHSNGYSLVRKIVFDIAGLKAGDFVEPCGATVGEVLLRPTTIYAKACWPTTR
jgi:phosphoribosylformylglycinamidine cyclo-ligase